MIFEISMLAVCVGFALLKYSFPGCFPLRVIICNVVQHIKQRNCLNAPVIYPSNVRRKARPRRSKQSKPQGAKSCSNENTRRRTVGANLRPSALSSKNILKCVPQEENQDCSSEPPVLKRSSSHDSPALNALDEKARNRKLFSTDEAKSPFTFKLDQYGGHVETPYLKLLFLCRAVLKEIEITVTPKYKWKDGREGKVQMTPEIFFSSKDDMKFLRPVEVQLETHFSSATKKEPIAVEIERTEHCVPPKWLKIDEVKFHKGMIKFFMHQFCGIRVVCDTCQRSIMSTRVSYSVSVKDSVNSSETEKNFYLRVYTDTPDQHQQILQEMEQDGYRRIHQTQKYTVRPGCDLMTQLSSRDCLSTPPFEIVNMHDDMIMEAVIFKVESLHGLSIMTSDLPIKTRIAEISLLKTTKMLYTAEPASTGPRHVNVTINGGSMIQANLNVGQVTQENVTLPPASNSTVETVPKEATLPISTESFSASRAQSSGYHIYHENQTLYKAGVFLPDPNMPVATTHPHVPNGNAVRDINPCSTVPKRLYPSQPPHMLPNGQTNPNLNSQMTTVPKIPYISHPTPGGAHPQMQAPQYSPDFLTHNPNPKLTTTPKAVFTPDSLQPLSPSTHMPHSVYVNPTTPIHTQRAFTVTQVVETRPKSPWGPEDGNHDARTDHSTPYGFQNQSDFQGPSPILHSGNNVLRRLSWSYSPPGSERISNPAFTVDGSDSHPSYTQTIGRFCNHHRYSQRSAFYRLARNSSHPSLSSFDFQPLTFNPQTEDEDQPGKQDILGSLLEEDQRPCNGSADTNNEVFEALANVASLEKPSSIQHHDNQSSMMGGSQIDPPTSPGDSPGYVQQGRPSAISSGFGSGLTTRNTSACTDAVYEGTETSAISPTNREEYPPGIQVPDPMRRRSASLSDTRKLAARLGKVREQRTRTQMADHSTQTTLKKTYSDAVKMPGSTGVQTSGTNRITQTRTRIPGPCKGKERRTGRRLKKS